VTSAGNSFFFEAGVAVETGAGIGIVAAVDVAVVTPLLVATEELCSLNFLEVCGCESGCDLLDEVGVMDDETDDGEFPGTSVE
jgi:hypothetical protein